MSRMKQVIMKLIRSQQAQNKEFQNGMFNDQLKKQLPYEYEERTCSVSLQHSLPYVSIINYCFPWR